MVSFDAVVDPELPMLTLAELGILRDVREVDGVVEVTITPTYAGCPALEAIAADLRAAAPDREVVVRTSLTPPWSSDDITEEGRRKLAEHGIAPPGRGPVLQIAVRCPVCGSPETRELSRFGSTSCKALWTCATCGPFDRFKEH